MSIKTVPNDFMRVISTHVGQRGLKIHDIVWIEEVAHMNEKVIFSNALHSHIKDHYTERIDGHELIQ